MMDDHGEKIARFLEHQVKDLEIPADKEVLAAGYWICYDDDETQAMVATRLVGSAAGMVMGMAKQLAHILEKFGRAEFESAIILLGILVNDADAMLQIADEHERGKNN